MVIKTSLSQGEFIRLSIFQHIQRKPFYFFALLCAALTAVALVTGPRILLAGAWIPFGLYLLLGIVNAILDSYNKENPYALPTRYEFTKKGVTISTEQDKDQLKWQDFSEWKVISKCYVLTITGGSIMAIPQKALTVVQRPQFEILLNKYIVKPDK